MAFLSKLRHGLIARDRFGILQLGCRSKVHRRNAAFTVIRQNTFRTSLKDRGRHEEDQ
jgi:hypothetical protein